MKRLYIGHNLSGCGRTGKKHLLYLQRETSGIQKDVNNNKKTAYKLTPDNGDSPVYFVVVNDTTLRLVNDSLQEAVSDLNYDIIQVK